MTTQTLDVATRLDVESLVAENLPLAHKIAFDYLSRAPQHTDTDDVISAALLGLVEASHRFDPAHGASFPSWASARIYGAVVDAARKQDPLTRRTRTKVRKLQQVEDQLTHQLGQVPDIDELAHAAAVSVETIAQLRADLHRGVVVSLDETLPDQPDSFAATLVAADPTPLESLERRELDSYLRDAVALLPPRLRDVVDGYFLHGKTNAEIAEGLGVTPQRVSQLRGEALRMLRQGVVAQFPDQFSGQDTGAAPAAGAAPARATTAQASYAAAIAARRTYAQRLSGVM